MRQTFCSLIVVFTIGLQEGGAADEKGETGIESIQYPAFV